MSGKEDKVDTALAMEGGLNYLAVLIMTEHFSYKGKWMNA